MTQGAWTPKVGERLKALEAREIELQRELKEAQSPAPRPVVTADGAELYKARVANLEAALNDPLVRDEAGEALRELIEKIVLTPDASAEGGLAAILHGVLAAILNLAAAPAPKQKLPRTGVLGSQLSLVAGTRCHLYRTTFRAS